MRKIILILTTTMLLGACEERINPANSWDRCRSSGINEFICMFHPIGDLVAEPFRHMH